MGSSGDHSPILQRISFHTLLKNADDGKSSNMSFISLPPPPPPSPLPKNQNIINDNVTEYDYLFQPLYQSSSDIHDDDDNDVNNMNDIDNDKTTTASMKNDKKQRSFQISLAY